MVGGGGGGVMWGEEDSGERMTVGRSEEGLAVSG